MYAPVQLIDMVTKNCFNYNHIIERSMIRTRAGKYDLCFYVPVRGRVHFFEPFYNYFKAAQQKSNLKIKLVIIENDEASRYNVLTKDRDIEFAFIPNDITKSEGLFAKSLCYNLGFLLNHKTLYHVFHDLDILIDPSYFKLLEFYINRGFTWLQPYSGKRVMRVGPRATQQIINNPKGAVLLDSIKDMRPANPGSPGGSILVKRNDIIRVGGYDPEFFCGYSPEDSFFWTKLEVSHGAEAPRFDTHFQGNAVFADHPKIDVYHLNHPPSVNKNPFYPRMLDVLYSFFVYNNKDRKKIIQTKKESLEAAINGL